MILATTRPSTTIAALEASFKAAGEHKDKVKPYVEDCYRYFAPDRLTSDGEASNPTGMNDIFDSTPMEAFDDYSSTIHSVIAPPGKKFAELAPGPAFKGEQKDKLATELEDVTALMFSYLNISNFDSVMGECASDYGISTANMAVHKGTKANPFIFQSVDFDDYSINRGAYGMVSDVWRTHKTRGKDIVATWSDAKLSKELEDLVKEKPDDFYNFRECQMPSPIKRKRTNAKTKKVEEYETQGFIYIVYYVGANNQREIIVEREQETATMIVFRNSPRGKNPWGFGPVVRALPDAKTINLSKEMIFQNASLALSGIYTYTDDGVINVDNITINPLTFIPVASNGSSMMGATIAELPRTGNFDLSQFVVKDLQESIRGILETNPLGSLSESVRSASEMSMRQQRYAQKSGSDFGRLNFEFLNPLIRRLLNILEDLGLVDLQNFRVDGVNMQIQHISPIAKAQEQEELTSITSLAEIVRGMYGEEAVHVVLPMEKTISIIGDLTGARASSYATVDEIKAAKAKAAEIAQQQQGAPEGGE